MAERINEKDFDAKVSKAQGLVLVDFYSDSCIPCKKLSPILSGIEEAYEGRAVLYKVNAVYDEGLSAKYQVMSAPTLILFKNGEVLDKKSGVQTKAELEKWLDGHLGS